MRSDLMFVFGRCRGDELCHVSMYVSTTLSIKLFTIVPPLPVLRSDCNQLWSTPVNGDGAQAGGT